MKNIILFITVTILCLPQKSFSQFWNTTGNTGTIAGTNFVGTTDVKDFVFKTNSTERGRIINGNGIWRFGGSANNCKIDSTGSLTFSGIAAYKVAGNKYAFQYAGNPNYGLFFNSTGLLYEFRTSTALSVFSIGANSGNGIFKGTLKVGAYTLPSTDGASGQVLKTDGTGTLGWSGDNSSQWTTSGSNIYYNTGNVGVGTVFPTVKLEVSGGDAKINGVTIGLGAGALSSNTTIGNNAMSFNTTGHENVAVGSYSLRNNLTGFWNTGCGINTLIYNTDGAANTAIGESALYNTTGSNNTAVGSHCLIANTSGEYNTAVGTSSLGFNTTSNGNTAMGFDCMYSNSGSFNSAYGFSALYLNTAGSSNVAFGSSALRTNSGGSYNAAFGSGSLYANSNGFYNVAIGTSSGATNATGSNNVFIGTAAGYKSIERSGLVIIGDSAGFNNNPTVGSLLSGAGNIFIGKNAGFSNTLGFTNTAVGTSALYHNIEGTNNTAFGLYALSGNTYGSSNVAIGSYALSGFNGISNTDGGNTVMGDHAMQFTSSGNNNVAIGLGALSGSSSIIGTGSSNVSIGTGSMNVNTSGSWNVAVGLNALRNNSTGIRNVGIGDSSLATNTFGSSNTASGYKSLSKTTSSSNSAFGYSSGLNNSTGTLNTFVGFNSGTANISGGNCTFIGASSGNASATTNWNTFIGALSGSTTTGGDNCFVGEESGTTNITGSQNTLLGNVTNVSTSALSNATAIGFFATVNATNKIRFGNSSVTVIEGTVAYTVSDGRFKTNISDDVRGLEFIKELKPVVYNFEAKKFDAFLNQNSTDEQKERMNGIDYTQAEKIRYSGFIAQDVEVAAKKVGYDFNGVHVPENANDNYSLAYSEFVVPLVKSVQELSAQLDSLEQDEVISSTDDIAALKTEMQHKDQQIADQQNQIQSLISKLDEMMNKMNNFETSLSQCCSNYQSTGVNGRSSVVNELPKLEQNVPNPFMQLSYIKFYIPSSTKSASIVVNDLNGRVVKTFSNLSVGFGTVNINGGELAAGNYDYTLFIDGNKIDTKQMTLTK